MECAGRGCRSPQHRHIPGAGQSPDLSRREPVLIPGVLVALAPGEKAPAGVREAGVPALLCEGSVAPRQAPEVAGAVTHSIRLLSNPDSEAADRKMPFMTRDTGEHISCRRLSPALPVTLKRPVWAERCEGKERHSVLGREAPGGARERSGVAARCAGMGPRGSLYLRPSPLSVLSFPCVHIF